MLGARILESAPAIVKRIIDGRFMRTDELQLKGSRRRNHLISYRGSVVKRGIEVREPGPSACQRASVRKPLRASLPMVLTGTVPGRQGFPSGRPAAGLDRPGRPGAIWSSPEP